jgi:three-Cys-motif partner protein
MDWSKKFFTRRRLTSKLKHLVLERYVKEFAYHLGSARGVIYYVDGFAGPGMYRSPGGEDDPGSPLLVARLAQQIASSQHPFELHCLNVEADPDRFVSLEEVTKPFQPRIVEKNYPASFVDVIPKILGAINTAPSFFFIDPFGTKDIAFRDLERIFQRPHTTEALITLHTHGIAKKAGYFARENSEDPKVRDIATKFTAHLAAALNITVDKLRDGWLTTGAKGNTEEFETRVLEYYLKQLRSRNTRFKFAKPFRVRYYRAGTLTERPVCFDLVFATGHEKGLFVMNDVMVDALNDFYREIYSDSFLAIFEPQREQQEGTAAVRREIGTRFSETAFTVDQLKRHCMQHAYLLKSAEYTRLIREMARSGELQKLDPGAPSNARTRYRVIVKPSNPPR